MSSITLYWFRESTSLAPHILLEEAGVQFNAVEITTSKESLAKLLEVNSKAKIPVLVIDDQVITESSAIMTAIAQLVPEKQLLGRNNLETVRVYEWINWLSGTFHGHAYGMILRPERYIDDSCAHEAVRAKGIEAAKEYYAFIEEKLTGTHMVGDHFTIVDPFVYVIYRWGVTRGLVTKAAHPKICALVSELVKRESVKKFLAADNAALIEL